MQPDAPSRVGNVYGRATVHTGTGNIDNRVDNRRNSFRLRIGKLDVGLGGLISIGVALLAGGGGTAAVVANEASKPSAAVQKAVGTWHLTAPKNLGSLTITAITLNISSAAAYQTTVQTKDADSTHTVPCSGEVTSRGDLLVLKPFDEAASDGFHCNTFTATVTGETMTVGFGETSAELHRS